MRLRFFPPLAFVLLVVLAASAPAQTGAAAPASKMKIAVVDVLAFRESVTELKAKYEKLTAEFQTKYRELDAMQNNIKAKEQVLQENKNLTPQQAAKLNEEYEQLKKGYTRTLEDSQALAGRREREETEATYDKLSKFMDEYCKKHGITHVFDAGRLRETGLVVYAAAAANITDDFIKDYNKAYPAQAAAAKP
ncbi:MAG: OmpH family outer membrane protein [Blastocatellia bacterium]